MNGVLQMRTIMTVCAAWAALSLSGCAAPENVRVHQLEGALPSCRTFAWHPVSGDAASFSDQRVKSAALATLRQKGYAIEEEHPDCRIAYQLRTQEIPKAKPGVGVGVGGGSRGVGGGIGVTLPIGRQAGYTGTFALDIIDAKQNAQVWSGALDVELAEAELSEADAQRLVDIVLNEYPDAP
jgi:hypothetical protein